MLLFDSVISGLYIKEATKVICAGSNPVLLGQGCLGKKGKMSMILGAGTVCGLNVSVCSLCYLYSRKHCNREQKYLKCFYAKYGGRRLLPGPSSTNV